MPRDPAADAAASSDDRRWRYLPVIVIGMNTLMIVGIVFIMATQPGEYTFALTGLLIALAMMNALAAAMQQQYKLILRLEHELLARSGGT